MNIPPETARAQGHHGIKGAAHGIKGGRPKLDLSDDERAERRRKQQEAWRRSKGISPKETHTTRKRRKNWAQDYVDVWGQSPGEPLTPEEFAEREPLWNARVLESIEQAERHDAAKLARRELRRSNRKRPSPPPDPIPEKWQPAFPFPRAATHSVGRNQPCPCGSGRKFKKCCGP